MVDDNGQHASSLLSLPIELIEHIVNFHSDEDDDVKFLEDGDFEYPPPSPTMLTLLLTSSQLRICALRHIYRHIIIYFGGSSRTMVGLRQIILPTTPHPRLGTIAPYIKSVHIRLATWDYDLTQWDAPRAQIDIALLEAIRDQSPLCTLSLQYSGRYTSSHALWNQLSPDFRQTINALIKLPSLQRAKFERFSDLDGELFQNISLQKLSLEHSTYTGEIRHSRISSLVISGAEPASLENIILPNLKQLVVYNLSTAKMDLIWEMITSTWRNIESLDVEHTCIDYITNIIPVSVSLNMLSLLERLSYHHSQGTTSAEQISIFPHLNFFDVQDSVSALKYLRITVILDKVVHPTQVTSRVQDPGWNILDRILTSGCFPNLDKFHFIFQQFIRLSWDSEDEEEELEEPQSLYQASICNILQSSFPLVGKSSIEFKPEAVIRRA